MDSSTESAEFFKKNRFFWPEKPWAQTLTA
jgi:hypothetical protein